MKYSARRFFVRDRRLDRARRARRAIFSLREVREVHRRLRANQVLQRERVQLVAVERRPEDRELVGGDVEVEGVDAELGLIAEAGACRWPARRGSVVSSLYAVQSGPSGRPSCSPRCRGSSVSSVGPIARMIAIHVLVGRVVVAARIAREFLEPFVERPVHVERPRQRVTRVVVDGVGRVDRLQRRTRCRRRAPGRAARTPGRSSFRRCRASSRRRSSRAARQPAPRRAKRPRDRFRSCASRDARAGGVLPAGARRAPARRAARPWAARPGRAGPVPFRRSPRRSREGRRRRSAR